MSKIYFETNQDKNELVDFLKLQSQQKDEILYGLLKEDGWQDVEPIMQPIKQPVEPKMRYKSSAEIIAEGGKCCQNCKHNINKGGISLKCDKGINNCLMNNHKYWEAENE